MVDVLVSSGLPKPWHAHQKETPALTPGFISGYFAPSSREKSSSPDRFAPYTRRALSTSSTKHQKQCSHLRRKGRMQCLSKDNMESMSHAQPSIEHYPSVKVLYDCIPDQITLPGQAGLTSSSPEFMAAPVMKTTASSDGLNDRLSSGSLNYFVEPYSAPVVNKPTAMMPAMSTAGIDWTAKATSFISATEDTPSLSSSFDFMDFRKEDSPVYQGLFFYPQEGTSHTAKPATFQAHTPPFNYPVLPLENQDSWGICTTTGDPDPWRQPYVSDNIADEQAWASAEYFPNSWPGPETAPTPVFINSTSTHPYEPYQQIPLSLDPTHNHNPILRHPSTPIPSDSDTEHPIPVLQPLETSINAYQGYRDLNAPLLPQPTDPTHNQPNPEPASIKANLHYSDSRNAFLIDCKQRGLSYKDIKRMGGFKEAESTLRGRFRTLTKTKEQRVRKPKWLDRDVKLLCDAVAIHTEPGPHAMPYGALGCKQPPKVPWKKVAQHIWAHGGSYQFGNATCKKKWCEIYDIKI